MLLLPFLGCLLFFGANLYTTAKVSNLSKPSDVTGRRSKINFRSAACYPLLDSGRLRRTVNQESRYSSSESVR